MTTIKLKPIADRLGWTSQRLWFILNKKKRIPWDEACKIEKASKGELKAATLCTDYKAIIKQMKKAL